MNKRLVAVIWIVVVLAVILVIVYGVRPRQAAAPAKSGDSAVSGQTDKTTSVPAVVMISLKENASTSPTVTVEYPSFPTLPAAFNADIASSTLTRLAEFRQEAADTAIARHATSHGEADIPASAYSFIASWEPARVDTKFVSGIERYDSYTGGANENQDMQTFNYDIAKQREMSLGDLFPGVKDYLAQISKISKAMLLKHFTEVAPDYTDTIGMLDDGTAAVAENFQDFTFTDDAVTIYFVKYAVAPGAFGEQSVTIQRASIK